VGLKLSCPHIRQNASTGCRAGWTPGGGVQAGAAARRADSSGEVPTRRPWPLPEAPGVPAPVKKNVNFFEDFSGAARRSVVVFGLLVERY
jgi:hypothetical protein